MSQPSPFAFQSATWAASPLPSRKLDNELAGRDLDRACLRGYRCPKRGGSQARTMQCAAPSLPTVNYWAFTAPSSPRCESIGLRRSTGEDGIRLPLLSGDFHTLADVMVWQGSGNPWTARACVLQMLINL